MYIVTRVKYYALHIIRVLTLKLSRSFTIARISSTIITRNQFACWELFCVCVCARACARACVLVVVIVCVYYLSKSTFSKKSISEIPSEYQTVWIEVMPDVLFLLTVFIYEIIMCKTFFFAVNSSIKPRSQCPGLRCRQNVVNMADSHVFCERD